MYYMSKITDICVFLVKVILGEITCDLGEIFANSKLI